MAMTLYSYMIYAATIEYSKITYVWFGIIPTSKNLSYCRRRVIFTERVPFSYACYGTFNKGAEGKGYSKRVVFFSNVTQLKGIFDGKGINYLALLVL